MDELIEKEHLIEQYVAENNIDEAIKIIFDLIVLYANKKDFTKSESLREKLIEIDPMALNEIVKSGEIIEEEKSKSIDKDHMDLWSTLYDLLAPEETNALYFAMKEIILDSNVTLFEQGKKNGSLYFVDQGRLKMICHFKGKDALLKEAEAGDFIGDDTFFSLTAFSSVSLITDSTVKLKYLEKTALEKWDENFPGLDNKLYNYCLKSGLTNEIINENRFNRRVHSRYHIKGIGIFYLLDKSGKPGSSFKGTLSDISLGGLCFFMRITKKQTPRLLLGRKLKIKFDVPTEKGVLKVEKFGTIIGIHGNVLEDSSVHIRFEKHLKQEALDIIRKKMFDYPYNGS